MAEMALTVGEVITRLQACDPNAYLAWEDDGFAVAVVAIHAATEDGHRYYGHLHEDPCVVPMVYLGLRGDRAAHDRLLAAMAAHSAAKPAD